MNRRALLLVVGLGALLVAIGVAWFLTAFERVSEDVPLPPRGEAALNPLYALRSALRAHGQPADTQRWFRPVDWRPGARDTLVMYGQAAPFSAADARRLLAWVEGGGHLVLRSDAIATSAEFSEALSLAIEGEDFGCFHLRSGVVATPPARTPATPVDTPPPTLRLCGATVHGDAAAVAGAAPDGGHRFARVAYGDGTVSLLPDLDFLHNRHLASPGARELAWQLLAPGLGRGGHVLMVYGDDVPSLWRLLLTHGWTVLVPLALALVAWLALRGQRFGTLRPVPLAHRRALLEHVQAAGEFAYRRGRAAALHAALLDRFARRLQRRDPLLAALEGEARVQALAERCALPVHRVRQALAPRELHRPDVFQQSVSTLAQMRLKI